jgi:hypothetical protein
MNFNVHIYILTFASLLQIRTMVNNVANEMEVYELLLSKLIIDMLQNSNKDPKKPKVKKMYYSSKA